MSLRLAAIADDYTGASDLANTWRRNGLRTIQTIGVPQGGLPAGDVDALVVALKIRSVPAGQAVALALEAESWLREQGVEHIIYKVCSTFDSTDQGNIGPVTEALAKRAGAAWTLVTPAFPETGRTVFQGHLFVGDVLLSDSPLRHHPLNPMTDASLVRVLARQSSGAVGLLDLKTIEAGPEAVQARIDTLTADGIRLIIADAVAERHLLLLGQIALTMPVSTGASGLGLGLARAIASGRNVASSSAKVSATGYSAVLVGSCSAKTLEQIGAAHGVMPVLQLDADRLMQSPAAEVDAALAWAVERLENGPVLISASDAPDKVAALQARYGRMEIGESIEQAMARLAQGLVESGVRRLVVAGGETSGAVVDALGVRFLEIGDEIAPGVPALRTLGRPEGELALVLKSGNFGGTDFFGDALGKL